MTVYGSTDGVVVGQPISPFFGAQNGVSQPAGGKVALPTNMTVVEAAARGTLPRNAQVSTINGVSTGLSNPVPVDDLACNGAGAQLNLGIPVAGVAGNPVSNGAIDQQQFVDGTGAVAQSANGPTPTSVESLTSAPVTVATTGGNVGLAGTYQG
jgi:hypothetical protein